MVHFFQATQPGLHSWCKNSWPLPFLKTQRNGPGEPFCFGPKELEESKVSPLSLEKALLLEWNPLCFRMIHTGFHIFFQHEGWSFRNKETLSHYAEKPLHPAITAITGNLSFSISLPNVSSMQDIHSGSPQSRQQPQEPPHSCSMMSLDGRKNGRKRKEKMVERMATSNREKQPAN